MKTPRLIAVTSIYFLFLFSYSQELDFSISNIPEEMKENTNSVVRFENISIEIQSQSQMSIQIKSAVTVLNKLGDGHSYVYVPFDNNQKIKSISIIIYNDFGKEIKKAKNKDYEEVSAVDGNTLYGDSRVMYYKYTPIAYPYTIVSEYEIETINTGFVPAWRPISNYLTSVMESSYSVKAFDNIEIRFKEKKFEGYNIEKQISTNSLSYKISNQKAIKREPYSPYLENLTPKLFVGLNKFSLEGIDGYATNWKEFGKWRYDYLLNGNDQISELVKNHALRLVEGVNDPIEKAKIIYNFVQNKVRYISVQEGIGGWMPIKAKEVHRLGYGDCKGLSNYTKTLLDAVGVEAYYTVIWAGDENRNIEEDFFSMQGNHIILNLPTSDGDVWLECTSQKVPFGYLGDFTDDRDVLVITPSGGIIKHTKIYSTSENLQSTTGRFEIDASGSIKASVKIASEGTQYMDNLLRNDGANQKELDKLFKNYFSYINNMKFSKTEVFNNRDEAVFEEDIVFEATNYSTLSGDEMLVPINAFNRNLGTPNRVRNRKLPFEISQSFFDIDEVEIKLPKSFEVVYIPENKKIESKFGTYSMTVHKIDEHTYRYKRTIQIDEGSYTKEAYELYREFRKNINKSDNSKIILKNKYL